MDPAADPADFDAQRILEGIRRGWLDPSDVALALNRRAEGEGPLDALHRQGLLDTSRLWRLRSAMVSLRLASSTVLRTRLAAVPEADPPEPLQPGDVIAARYEIEKALDGGFGRVFLCRVLGGDQCFALKTIRRKLLAEPRPLEMLRSEFLLWVRFGPHPNLVTAYGVEEFLRLPFVVLEYVEGGRTLGDLIQRGQTSWKDALRFGLQVAAGLGHAGRAAGMVHRDLKPGNVLVTPDLTAKVTDFGLALVRGAGRDAEGAIVGTPPYMAPEQWRAQEVDPRTDLYALGIILFELALRRRPFPDYAQWQGYQRDHCLTVPDNPCAIDPRVPRPLADLILRCLAKDPDDRPPDFRTVEEDLAGLHESFLGETPRRPVPDVPPEVVGLANLSKSYANLGLAREAVEPALQAVARRPRYTEGHIALGNAYMDLGRPGEAIPCYLAAQRLYPGHASALGNLALACHQTGNEDEAGRWAQEALERARKGGGLHEIEGLTAILARVDPRLALSVCDEILAKHPNAVSSWNNRATILHLLDRDEEALASAERALGLNPRYAMGWANRAQALTGLGRWEDALAAVDEALRCDPHLAAADYIRTFILRRLGRAPEESA